MNSTSPNLVRAGANRIEVVVYGSLKNLLGPASRQDQPGAGVAPEFPFRAGPAAGARRMIWRVTA